MDFDYKKYSLEKLQDWVHDALSSGEASPHEIYSAIREAVREDYYYHKDHISRASGLLELLSGNRPVADDGMRSWGHSDIEYQIANESLSCDKDDPSPECQSAWNDFWEEDSKQDKVVRWQLPVQQIIEEGVDSYFVQFPDDLLEATNLKEGDQVEWVDRGDGSYLLRKVNV